MVKSRSGKKSFPDNEKGSMTTFLTVKNNIMLKEHKPNDDALENGDNNGNL